MCVWQKLTIACASVSMYYDYLQLFLIYVIIYICTSLESPLSDREASRQVHAWRINFMPASDREEGASRPSGITIGFKMFDWAWEPWLLLHLLPLYQQYELVCIIFMLQDKTLIAVIVVASSSNLLTLIWSQQQEQEGSATSCLANAYSSSVGAIILIFLMHQVFGSCVYFQTAEYLNDGHRPSIALVAPPITLAPLCLTFEL